MKKEIIKSLTNNFESHSHKTKKGIEFWFARDLQKLLGYDKWENFQKVIEKAKITCKTSKEEISDHFPDVGKMVNMPKGAQKEVDDIKKIERKIKSETQKDLKSVRKLKKV